jgi:hypothetical protein
MDAIAAEIAELERRIRELKDAQKKRRPKR